MVRTLMCLVAIAAVARAQQVELPKNTNAALGYWRAFNQIKKCDEQDKEFWKKVGKVTGGEEPYDGDVLDEWLDENAGALQEFHLAVRRPDCDFGIDLEEGFGASMPHLGLARTLGRLVSLEGARHSARGHDDQALGCWLDGVRLAEHISRDRFLISGLVATSILSLNLWPLSSWLSSNSASLDQLDRVDAVLRALPVGMLDWSSMLAMEETLALKEFDRIMAGVELVELLALTAGEEAKERSIEEFARLLGKTVEQLREPGAIAAILKEWRSEYVETLRNATLALGGPVEESERSMRAIESAISPSNALLQMQFVSIAELGPSRMRTESQRAGLIGLIALARHVIKHHGDPAALDGLDIPADPFTGKEFDYRVEKDALVLTGAGKDNQGQEISFRLRK